MTRQTQTAAQLREVAASCADARASRRMLAIALVWEGVPRWKAAQSCGMDRQTLRDWIHRFHAEGVAGLCDRPHGGGPAGTLNPAHQAAFVAWVETGPEPQHDKVVRWRRRDLRDKLAEQFGVHLPERSVGKLLRRLGFRHVSVRPRHPKADQDAQAAQKKTSANSLQGRSRTPRAASQSRLGGKTKPVLASKAP